MGRYKPSVGGEADVKYFDKEFLDMPVVDSEEVGEKQ
eukprot:gene106-77_t